MNRYIVQEDEGQFWLYDTKNKQALKHINARTKDAAINMANARNACEAIVGVTENIAKEILAQYGYSFRISNIDGKGQTVTLDHQSRRANVLMSNGLVSSLDYWG